MPSAFSRNSCPAHASCPGFTGFYLLTDAETGKLIVISLWDTREQMDAVTAQAGSSGIRDEAGTGLTALHLETYEVTAHEITD
jgi:heme-degrading monooxygenase HmoA